MSFLLKLLALPITAPVDGLMSVFRVIQNEVDDEFSNPDVLRTRLLELNNRLDAGEISEADYETLESDILDRLDTAYARLTNDDE